MNHFNYTQATELKFRAEKKVSGVTYMFSGQGSAKPGMFSSFVQDEIFQMHIKKADVFLKQKKLNLASEFLNGKVIDHTDMALIRNISLFACEVALFKKMEEIFPPGVLVGHSFGEFAALVCCGAINFEEMLRYIYMRETACPKETNGGMLVVGKIKTNLEKLEKIDEIYLANLNSYNQYAYSFALKDKDELFFKLKRQRVPFVHLQNLKFPYHSPVMEEAKQQLRQSWNKKPIKLQTELKYKFYSYVTQKTYTQMDEIAADIGTILVEQLVTPVNFVKTIESCLEKGLSSFVECGPDNTLEVFTKNICKEQESDLNYHIHHIPKELAKKNYGKQLLKSKWFKALGGILTDVTGYQVKELDVNYDFQKDLGIDSIKKAEVLYKTLDAQKLSSVDQISLSTFKTVGEFVEFMENYSDNSENEDTNQQEDPFHIYQLGRTELESSENYPIITTGPDSLFIESRDQTDAKKSFELIKSFISKYHGDSINNLDIHLMENSILSYGMASFIKSYVRDESFGVKIHFASDPTFQGKQTDCVEHFYEGEKVFSEKLQKVKLSSEKKDLKTVVFIGAHNGLGKVLVEKSQVLKEVQKTVILGRSLADKEDGRIVYRKCDITDHKKLKTVLDEFDNISLVINAAGIEISKNLEETTQEDFDLVYGVKYEAPIYLAQYCKQNKNIPFVQFSSVVGYFGGRGQFTYAMANEMCTRELMRNFKNCTVINWPALDKIGMTENLGIYQKIKESGLTMLKGEEAIKLFDKTLLMPKENKSLFYLTQKDSFILDHHLYNVRDKEMNGLKMLSPKSLSKTVDTAKEKLILDHSVNEIIVYPASHFIQDSLGLAKHLYQRYFSHWLGFDIEVLNVGLFHNGQLNLDYLVEDRRLKEDMGFFILANKVEYAKVELKSIVDKSPKVISNDHTLNLDLSSLYNDNVITFGPAFQVTKEFYCNDDKDIGEVRGHFTRPWELIEAGFQALSILCGANGGGLSIPQKLSGLSVNIVELNTIKDNDEFCIKAHLLRRKNTDVYGRFVIEKNGNIIGHCDELYSTTVRHFDKELLKFTKIS